MALRGTGDIIKAPPRTLTGTRQSPPAHGFIAIVDDPQAGTGRAGYRKTSYPYVAPLYLGAAGGMGRLDSLLGAALSLLEPGGVGPALAILFQHPLALCASPAVGNGWGKTYHPSATNTNRVYL